MLGSSFVPKTLSNVKVDPSPESKWFNVSIDKNDIIKMAYLIKQNGKFFLLLLFILFSLDLNPLMTVH